MAGSEVIVMKVINNFFELKKIFEMLVVLEKIIIHRKID